MSTPVLQVYTNIPEEATEVPLYRVGPVPSNLPATQTVPRATAAVVGDSFLVHVLDSLARISGIDYVYGGSDGMLQGTTDPVWTYYHTLVWTLRKMDSRTRRNVCSNLLSKMHTLEKTRFEAALKDMGFTLDLTTGKFKRV